MSVMIRHRLGPGDGEVVGCDVCHEVEHVPEGSTHHCNSRENNPCAATIETERLTQAKSTPTYLLASPANQPAILDELLKTPPS